MFWQLVLPCLQLASLAVATHAQPTGSVALGVAADESSLLQKSVQVVRHADGPMKMGQSYRVVSGNIEVLNRDLYHSKIDKEEKTDQPLLLIAVTTARENSFRRSNVRGSWWRHPSLNMGSSKALFFVGEEAGAGDNSTAEHGQRYGDEEKLSTQKSAAESTAELSKEMAEHKDIIQLPVSDTFKNLARKTGALLDWFAREKPARFLLKIDDDSYPHLDLMPMLSLYMASDNVYMGLLKKCTPVERTGIYAETAYPEAVFPWYMNGAAYILGSSLVQKMAALSNRTFLNNEDASVGLWAGKLVNSGVPVEYVPVNVSPFGCHENDVFSTNVRHDEMACMYETRRCCSKPSYIQSDLMAAQQYQIYDFSRGNDTCRDAVVPTAAIRAEGVGVP